MGERRFFVESFDLTDEFRKRQRSTWLALLCWGLVAALAAMWAVTAGWVAMLLASALIVAIAAWFWSIGFEKYAVRRSALRKGKIEGLYRIGNGFVEYVERTATKEPTVIERLAVNLDSSCSVEVLPKGLSVRQIGPDDFAWISIPNNVFVDEGAVKEFLEMCESRFVEVSYGHKPQESSDDGQGES